MKYIRLLFALGLVLLTGCSETEESVVTDNTLETVGSRKMPEAATPAAPEMPGVGIPKVTEVSFYKDWKLTKPMTQAVAPGTQVFIKVVFSEPMKHNVSDGKQARPILYYKEEGKKMVQFKMAAHGAGGKDFIPGDAKPLGGGTDDYLCKYTVPEAGTEVAFMVGKLSVDLQGNTLAAFYRHSVKLQVQTERTKQPIPIEPSVDVHPGLAEEPITQEYIEGFAVADLLPESAWVLDFPGPYREYAPPESSPRDFVGRVCMRVASISMYVKEWATEDYIAPVSSAIVTITKGPRRGEQVTTNEGGYYHFKDVDTDNLYLRVERVYLEPKEVIVYRTRPTELQNLRPNEVFNAEHQSRERVQNAPGTILMGLRWPDAVRFILEEELMPHDLLCSTGVDLLDRFVAGLYGGHHISIINTPKDRNALTYGIFAHELAHARQHAVAIMHGVDSPLGSNWGDTPEGRAYEKAWKKDLEEVPKNNWLGPLDKSDYFDQNLHENAAEFCSFYWELKIGSTAWNYELTRDGGIQARAPNRYKWAETHLNTKYNN